jgi:copper homeostasis protein (lipoprotein)
MRCALVAAWLAMAAALALPAAVAAESAGRDVAASAALGVLPATFAGDLPCAECPALRTTLRLMPDGAFFLREVYAGRSEPPSYDIGRWMLSSDGVILQLAGGREAPVRLRRVDADALQLLAPDGSERPPGPRPWLLRRVADEPLAPQLLMGGLVRLDVDPPTFAECLSGQRWPIAADSEAAALRAAVKAARGAGPVLVNVEGALLPAADASAAPTLRVQRVNGVWPGKRCRDRAATSSLTNMYWKLTLLRGEPVYAVRGQREPSLILTQADGRSVARGSAGCRAYTGPFELAGNRLTIAPRPVAGAKCATGLAAEQAYLEALAQVRSWRTLGLQLELFDGDGALLARYEARALR